MKKLILASAALCAAASISAQEVVEAQPQAEQSTESSAKTFKAGSDRFGAEAGFTFGDGLNLNGGNLNFNYSLSDELTLRLGFGVNVTKTSEKADEFDAEAHETSSSFDIKPGIAYSFSGTNRLEPYVGAELLFGLNSTCEYSYAKAMGVEAESETKTRSPRFGANAFTGFNFYVAQDLYVGAEVGFGFVVTPKTHKFGTNEAGEDFDSKDDNTKGHTTNIGAQCNPSIRIGWKF
ncbi:MAG: hypothetical protein KBT22_07185 [Bacteroidales bacterium]|nr:hypothetical protein [Candidatus Scybalocola fimicaballi]